MGDGEDAPSSTVLESVISYDILFTSEYWEIWYFTPRPYQLNSVIIAQEISSYSL